MTTLITHSSTLTPEVEAAVQEAFTFRSWTDEQVEKGKAVRAALVAAVKTIIANVPPSPTRTVAIQKLFEARMDAHAAITFQGKI